MGINLCLQNTSLFCSLPLMFHSLFFKIFRNLQTAASRPCPASGPTSSPSPGSRQSCWCRPRTRTLARLEAGIRDGKKVLNSNLIFIYVATGLFYIPFFILRIFVSKKTLRLLLIFLNTKLYSIRNLKNLNLYFKILLFQFAVFYVEL